MGFMDKFRSSSANRVLQKMLRVLQFLSALVSLVMFSSRLAKIIRLTQLETTSNGAVEDILAAAVAYTITTVIMALALKMGASKLVRWALMVLDILFLGAFIAVTYLTRPAGGSSGPCRKTKLSPHIPKNQNCILPWGTFILAILSTILRFLTALFHEVRDHHKETKRQNDYMESNPTI